MREIAVEANVWGASSDDGKRIPVSGGSNFLPLGMQIPIPRQKKK